MYVLYRPDKEFVDPEGVTIEFVRGLMCYVNEIEWEHARPDDKIKAYFPTALGEHKVTVPKERCSPVPILNGG